MKTFNETFDDLVVKYGIEKVAKTIDALSLKMYTDLKP